MKSITKHIFLSLSTLFIFSCSFHQGDFKITNKSDFNLDSVSIIPNTKHQLVSIEKGETINYYTAMKEASSDGSYTISFQNSENKEIISKTFGYHSSGMQLEDEIQINITNDDVLITYIFDNYGNQ
jgi:hypothetical protein